MSINKCSKFLTYTYQANGFIVEFVKNQEGMRDK